MVGLFRVPPSGVCYGGGGGNGVGGIEWKQGDVTDHALEKRGIKILRSYVTMWDGVIPFNKVKKETISIDAKNKCFIMINARIVDKGIVFRSL